MKTVHLSIETGPRFRNPFWMMLIVGAYYLDLAAGWKYRGLVWCALSRVLYYTKVRAD